MPPDRTAQCTTLVQGRYTCAGNYQIYLGFLHPVKTCVEFLQCCKTRKRPFISNNRQNDWLKYYDNVTSVLGVPENPRNSFETRSNGREEERGRYAPWEPDQLAWLDLQIARSLRILYLTPLLAVYPGFFTDSYIFKYARHARR